MPVIAKERMARPRVRALVHALAQAIARSEGTHSEPLVVESRIAQTKSLHLIVIWDAWGELMPAERSEVIRAAYARARRLGGSTITAAMGLTSEEAMRLGFLGYGIVTTRRPGDKAEADELAKAMAAAGGIVVKIGAATQLRFATLEQAQDAYRYLSQKVPGPYWAIIQEQSAAE